MSPLWQIFKYYRNGITAIMLLSMAIFLMLAARAESTGLGGLQETALDIIGPVQRMLNSPVELFRHAQNRFGELLFIDSENAKLRRELNSLRPKLIHLDELAQENRRLRELLNMPDATDSVQLASRVIGDSSSAFSRSFVLNVGKKHGVVADLPVVSAQGLVGRIIASGRNDSQGLAILDINSRVPSIIQRSRVQAMVVGTNNEQLQLEYLAKGADVEAGDLIITSGNGGIFPKGLVVGVVDKIERNGTGLFQRATVKPAVDFSRLEEVRVLVTPPGNDKV